MCKKGQAQVNCELNCTGMYKKINNWWICRPVLKLHVALFFYEDSRTSPHLLKITETLFILVWLHFKHLIEQHYCEMVSEQTLRWVQRSLQKRDKPKLIVNWIVQGCTRRSTTGGFADLFWNFMLHYFFMKNSEQAHIYWRLRKPSGSRDFGLSNWRRKSTYSF